MKEQRRERTTTNIFVNNTGVGDHFKALAKLLSHSLQEEKKD